jgi:hypothetical protein
MATPYYFDYVGASSASFIAGGKRFIEFLQSFQ